MSFLHLLGFKPFFSHQDPAPGTSTAPARVVCVLRSTLQVLGESGERRILRRPTDPEVAVGDWLAIRPETHDPAAPALMEAVYERMSLLQRKTAGRRSDAQLMAANVDLAFLVTTASPEFRRRRLERYLVAVAEGGCTPVILVNKIDACADARDYLREAQAAAPNALVLGISARERIGLEAVRELLHPHRTAVFLGSSGVGKSTLLNSLLDAEVQRTASTGERARGCHTTTQRQLFLLPDGIVIDTPGMREFQPLAERSALDDTFADVAAWARHCRFRDCSHGGEPGCAVHAAVEAGELDANRHAHFLELAREQAHAERRQSERLRTEHTRSLRRRGREYRRVQRSNPKNQGTDGTRRR